MNVIVQLGLAAHKKAPEKNLQFTHFFPSLLEKVSCLIYLDRKP